MSKRLVTENWYRFLKEYEDLSGDQYINDPEEGIMARDALAELEALRAQKAHIEERIRELEMQMAASAHSVSQIKENKDG